MAMAEVSTYSTIPTDILDDLSSRFIINVPAEERADLVRICFQIELAHWFYLDFYCTGDKKKCGMKEFTWNIFNHLPFLKQHVKNLQTIMEKFREYKQSVPTYGAIILDQDMSHVLLVQGFYAKSSWGFPKGKVNEEEDPLHCAIREVQEETGFDITPLADENEYIEANINDQTVRLYLVAGVPLDTKFNPCTRCEIRACEWFPLADLPSSKKDMTPKMKIGLGPNNFFMVMPFMKRVKRWIAEKTQKDVQQQPSTVPARRTRLKSQGDTEAVKVKKQQQQQQQLPAYLQAEIMEFQQVRAKSQNAAGQTRGRRMDNANGRSKQGVPARRQIFKSGEDDKSSGRQSGSGQNNFSIQYDKNGMPIITAPSWTNFKFDRQAFLQQITS